MKAPDLVEASILAKPRADESPSLSPLFPGIFALASVQTTAAEPLLLSYPTVHAVCLATDRAAEM